ncbi:MAG: polysaccharide deacetylase family protein [Candidatus Omnitrophica bacterium]|nr:polysaccharide deacetylase family protein [Candidatus Omnitrophota bacterium]
MIKKQGFLASIPSFAIFNNELDSFVIPSFILHKEAEDDFERKLLYLKKNNYLTLGIEEYYGYLSGRKNDNNKKVIITFDDGLRNNWSIIFPLLKKYDAKAVFYVNPSNISDEIGLLPNLEDVWSGKITLQELKGFDKQHPFIGWQEARKMEASGLVDIESHSWEHKICFTSDKIVDFERPAKDGSSLNPWLFTAIDKSSEDNIFGSPVYPYQPRLLARRFFDDTGLRQVCIETVKSNGGRDFFLRRGWKEKLQKAVVDYKKAHKLQTRFENEIEQELAIKNSLEKSKLEIESRLNKQCLHFAFPWNMGGNLSVLWLKELGFKTVFRYMNSWNIPRAGSDLFGLCRVEGCWVGSLPGKGRELVWDKLRNRFIK